jgi:hypothetical protein
MAPLRAGCRWEGFALVICELCGTGNNEMETECRVCGQPLPVAVAAAPVQAPPVAPPPPADIATVPAHLQMSAFAQDVSTGAPPMFGETAPQEEEAPPPSPDSYVPAFLQGERHTVQPDPEATGLISANDLPDWIKQIAAQDAAKEAAQVEQAAAHADNFNSIQRRQLPGETIGTGPQTNWLTKTAGGADASEHWSSAEAASANWGVFEPPKSEALEAPVYEAAVPTTAFVPSVIEEAPAKAGGRFGRSQAEKPAKVKKEKSAKAPKQPKVAPSGDSRPFYRNQTIQLLLLVVLVALIAAMLLM